MRRRWTDYAPWPFVGAAVLLVILILLTPILVSTGHPAPGVLTQAELVVDRVPGGNVTYFYVIAYGEAIRYAGIWIGVDENLTWDGTSSVDWSTLHWTTYYNATNTVVVAFNSSKNPVALNVTAYYTSQSFTALYVGEIAFFVGRSAGSEQVFASSHTPGVFIPSTTPVDNASQPFYTILASVPVVNVP